MEQTQRADGQLCRVSAIWAPQQPRKCVHEPLMGSVTVVHLHELAPRLAGVSSGHEEKQSGAELLLAHEAQEGFARGAAVLGSPTSPRGRRIAGSPGLRSAKSRSSCTAWGPHLRVPELWAPTRPPRVGSHVATTRPYWLCPGAKRGFSVPDAPSGAAGASSLAAALPWGRSPATAPTGHATSHPREVQGAGSDPDPGL